VTHHKLLDERPLFVLPSLAKALGLNEAIALQQLHWALGRDTAETDTFGRRWLGATVEFWCGQFPFWGEATVKRTFASLVEKGIVDRRRRRDDTIYRIDYDALTALCTDQGDPPGRSERSVQPDQDDPYPCKRANGERGEIEELPGADGSAQLFGTPDTKPPAPDASDEDEKIADVWAHYVETFGERLRVKELTPPRERTIRKALRAISGDVALAKRAIDGLKSYRASGASQSTDVSISVIFETGPHSKSNLADQIEWWAGQSQSSLPSAEEDRSNIPIDLSTVPSVTKGRIEAERRHVTRMFAHPDDEAAQDRGRKALDWLRESVGHEPKVENGELHGWRQVTP
jgi:hypothetical protein